MGIHEEGRQGTCWLVHLVQRVFKDSAQNPKDFHERNGIESIENEILLLQPCLKLAGTQIQIMGVLLLNNLP